MLPPGDCVDKICFFSQQSGLDLQKPERGTDVLKGAVLFYKSTQIDTQEASTDTVTGAVYTMRDVALLYSTVA